MSTSRPMNILIPSANEAEARMKLDNEQTLEEQLLDTPSSMSNSLYEICQCCGRSNCENLEYFTQLIRKLESDTRLAAEIGQSLLHKHENYVTESNQQRSILENQLEEYQAKIQALEASLDNVDEVIKEKNKWHWEYQKRQKILDETISDLEIVNEKCNQLSTELQDKTNELEKLRIFKFMMRHSESREEALTSKLEDTSQELAVCRKNELLLESKMKKLKTKYENLCNSHEKLLRDFEDRMTNALTVNNHRNTTQKITDPKYKPDNANDLIDLIKELSLANTKLKLDLINCQDHLSEAKGEIDALNQKIDDMNDQEFSLKRSPMTTEAIPIRTNSVPMPTVSSSMPTSEHNPSAIYHHYHYYTKDKKGEYVQLPDEQDVQSSDGELEKSKEILLSPTKSTFFNLKDGTTTTTPKSPFFMLQEHVAQVLERLRGSDIRALNRRLKRAFDITELTSMSNSIIDNIIMELETLESRFLWVKSKASDKEQSDLEAFFPLLTLLKSMLKELGVLRSTMNELQVEYVKKVEESEIRVEEEILRKRELKKQSTATSISTTAPVTIPSLSWFTNMFTRGTIHDDKGSTITNTSTLVHSPDDDEQHFFRSARSEYLRRQPMMSKSTSTGTTRSSMMRKMHRINIDYEGIGPATIRPIPSERDGHDFSASWLGGK